ncbi:hypothetical protein KSP40_PGU012750 [Platanthera guangdongensis]|uniref:Polygalacturonase n=1 Tax=Platanthera guangdongensis TaxID=2320717 RepID=A0ABR2LJE1_9ASPA
MITSLILTAGFFHLSSSELTTYSITDSGGAVPEGGSADWTGRLVDAWTKACGSNSPATVAVPAGTFFVRHVVLVGPCRSSHISVNIAGTIVSPATYTSEEHWIVFMNVTGLTISGGVFDGRGQAVWNCKNGKRNCPNGATIDVSSPFIAYNIEEHETHMGALQTLPSLLSRHQISPNLVAEDGAEVVVAAETEELIEAAEQQFFTMINKYLLSLAIMNSNNVRLNRVSSVNSEMFHILIYGSRDVLVAGARISALDGSPNTDGIHIQESSGVTVLGSNIATGDDCISIGPGSANVWIESIKCGPGHGISIGSLGSEKVQNGVRNVTAKHVEFFGTDNGFRIKTWAKPSDGFVEHVLFQNATMNNVKNPIIIDQRYCPQKNNCPTKSSGIQISDVVFRDVEGTSATEVAVELYCSSSKPCRDVWLMNINLRSAGVSATMSCSNVNGGSHGVISPPCCLAQ